jgi:hypothetical protein
MTDDLTWTKDPAASLRYGFDVVDLLAPGDTLATVSITEQTGITAADPQYAGTAVFCRVSGGAAGQQGQVTLRWTTAQGDTDERTLRFTLLDL